MSKVKLDYNIDWSEYFRLDVESPSGLTRIKGKRGNKIKPYFVGTKIFSPNKNPIGWTLSFKYQVYLIHRIIWKLNYGSIDRSKVIDHLDGNPLNNSISNLTLKTQADNTKNAAKYSNNVSGTTGVSFKSQKNSEGWVAFWNELDGTRRTKFFSVSKMDYEDAKKLAVSFREEQMKRLISEGADYTDRHGN